MIMVIGNKGGEENGNWKQGRRGDRGMKNKRVVFAEKGRKGAFHYVEICTCL